MSIFSKIKKSVVSDDAPKAEVKNEGTSAGEAEVKAEKKSAKKSESKKDAIVGRDTKMAYKILVKPLVSEKNTLMAQENKYAFEVSMGATKNEIKKAINAVYNVEPIKVNIISNSGKEVRFRRVIGRRKDWKKAIVTLKEGDKIEIYEGV